MSATKKATAPRGLAVTGKALWADVVGAFDLEPVELAVLTAACRQADAVTALEDLTTADGMVTLGSAGQPRVHPAMAEARQGRLALARLLGQLALPGDDDEDQRPMTAAQRRASRAAHVRWANHRQQRGLD